MSISKVSGETIKATFGGGYALQGTLDTIEFNPASVTSYYGGDAVGTTASITPQSRRIYIPKTGTIKSCYGYFNQNSSGSGNTGTLNIRLNNTTDTSVGTAAHNTTSIEFSGNCVFSQSPTKNLILLLNPF